MKATKNTVVSLTYQLRTEPNGDVQDEATLQHPFEFLFGYQNVLDKFEDNLEGKSANDKFAFTLSPEEGYGEYDQNALIQMPKSSFVFEGEDASHMIEVGNIIPLQDQDGNPFQGRITEVKENDVFIDMNHPFAGKTLFFTGEVIAVREAHATELQHGHVHSAGNHDHH